MNIHNRKFLVTGGAGFIGSHLVDRLVTGGCARVVVIDDFNDFYDPSIKERNLAAHRGNRNVRVVKCDIRDHEALAEVFTEEKFDALIHLAARAGVRPSLDQARLYQEVNLGGTLLLLDLARAHGIQQFVFASSSSVYGPRARPPFTEEMALEPISPYAATKAGGEMLAHTYSHLYGMRIVCLRFFTVYGARQRPDLAIHKFARKIANGEPVPLYGDGSTERDYTYIEDILDGLEGAIGYARAGATPFEVINLGESHTISLSRLVSLLEAALGRKAIIDWRPAQPGDMPRTHASIGKARRLLGYSPSTPVEAGIGRFAEWFNSNRKETLIHA
ncbi:MAG: GDP-mannose 4,6-dehydratase [Bryobacteraceae bacterium]